MLENQHLCLVLGDKSLWISHISANLASEVLIALCYRLTFQGRLYIKLPWETEIVSL